MPAADDSSASHKPQGTETPSPAHGRRPCIFSVLLSSTWSFFIPQSSASQKSEKKGFVPWKSFTI